MFCRRTSFPRRQSQGSNLLERFGWVRLRVYYKAVLFRCSTLSYFNNGHRLVPENLFKTFLIRVSTTVIFCAVFWYPSSVRLGAPPPAPKSTFCSFLSFQTKHLAARKRLYQLIHVRNVLIYLLYLDSYGYLFFFLFFCL